jgi:phage terminase large subunit GpA-like protein
MGNADRWALTQLAALLRPHRRLRVSEWADAHRRLSEKSSPEPGPWRSARNPLLRAIMDSLSETCDVPEVVAMKPSQFGGTEVATNWIGYILGHIRTPKPTLVVVPTDRLLVKWVLQRFRPMIEGAACLRQILDVSKSRDGTNRLDIVDYPGGLLYFTTANSSAGLKSDSIRFCVEDEVDEFPWNVGERGDPEGLIESRMAAFSRRKRFRLSTPSVKGASRIEMAYAASDRRRYHVCCPQCGERQVLEWEHLQWTPDLSQVWYACAVNGCIVQERDKPAMLREAAPDYPQGGQWIAQSPERSRESHGYAWNALYTPIGLGYSWRELAAQWLAAQDSDERLQSFVNERLGRTWEDRRTAVRVEDLVARAEPYPLRTLPRGALLVTAGVDTQDDRLACQLIGWGRGGSWWVLDYVEISGDPDRPEVWVALQDLLSRPLATVSGTQTWIEATAIDMAGHKTESVKAFVRNTRLPRCIAVLGNRYRMATLLGRPVKVDYTASGKLVRHGMRYHQVGTELAKDALYESIRGDTDLPSEQRLAHYPVDLVPPPPTPSPYLRGLMSEVWNPRKQRYEPKRGETRANEPLDTWVYARAAAEHPEIRLGRLRKSDWDARERRLWGGVEDAADDAPPPVTPEAIARPSAPARPAARPAPEFGKEGWGL